MRYAKVEIEGRLGRATVQRQGNEVLIRLVTRVKDGGPPARELRVDARPVGKRLGYDEDDDHLYLAACELQQALDGVKGTQGDIAGYLRVIQHFSD